MKAPRTHSTKGFSLVEVMVAVGIFALGIVGGLSVMNTQWNMVRRGQEQLYVGHILESRIEELRELLSEAGLVD